MKKTAHTFDEENIKYLREVLGDEKVDTFFKIADEPETGTAEEQKDCETVKKCLELMEKFLDNRWWLSEDKKVLAYYQLMNSILLVPFEKFQTALLFLLNRPIMSHELICNYEGLKAEAERAFSGKEDSLEQKKELIHQYEGSYSHFES